MIVKYKTYCLEHRRIFSIFWEINSRWHSMSLNAKWLRGGGESFIVITITGPKHTLTPHKRHFRVLGEILLETVSMLWTVEETNKRIRIFWKEETINNYAILKIYSRKDILNTVISFVSTTTTQAHKDTQVEKVRDGLQITRYGSISTSRD